MSSRFHCPHNCNDSSWKDGANQKMQASNATLDQSMRVAKISEVKAAYWGEGFLLHTSCNAFLFLIRGVIYILSYLFSKRKGPPHY